MIIDNKFYFGQTVYLKHDAAQMPRMVIRFSVGPCEIEYKLACGTESSWHSEIEISDKKSESLNVNGFKS